MNYPPGVTGREPQITGEWPCADCGAMLPEDIDCADCGGQGVTAPDIFGNRDPCPRCEAARERLADGVCPDGCVEPDWDSIREREAEESLEDRYGG